MFARFVPTAGGRQVWNVVVAIHDNVLSHRSAEHAVPPSQAGEEP